MKLLISAIFLAQITPAICSELTERNSIAPRQERSAYERLQDADNPVCCTSIGAQQCLYTCGCTCEHPCAYTTALGCAGAGSSAGTAAASIWGPLSLEIGLPIGICVGIPFVLITCGAACETYNRCTTQSANQLEYIMDPKNWPKGSRPPRTKKTSKNYGSGSNQHSDGDWSGPDLPDHDYDHDHDGHDHDFGYDS